MTAEDYLQDSLKISYYYDDNYDRMCCFSDDVQLAMKEYAKLKCKELLEIVAEEIENNSWYVNEYRVLEDFDLDEFIV